MAQQLIDIGTTANDGTGDQLRDAFDKVNQNDTELYAAVALNTAAVAANAVVALAAPATSKGVAGDLAGQIAYATGFLYICTADYTTGLVDIWQRIPVTEDVQPW